jgi:hypothetical protein
MWEAGSKPKRPRLSAKDRNVALGFVVALVVAAITGVVAVVVGGGFVVALVVAAIPDGCQPRTATSVYIYDKLL